MPSKYKSKVVKPIEKQGSWKPKQVQPRCTNCGRIDVTESKYSKCWCGGTLQKYAA